MENLIHHVIEQAQGKTILTMSRNPLDRNTMIEHGGFALWGNRARQEKRLIEFRAGKMFVRDKIVYPDVRKGLVYIYQDDESTIHFCWMDRAVGATEDDFLTMPTDCFFKRIQRCTTGRVYLLKMKSSNRTHFYWMQEPSSAGDIDICKRVNQLLNFPPPRLLFPEQIFNNELGFILNQLNAEQLQALYNGENVTLLDPRSQSNESRYIESSPGISGMTAEPETPSPFVNLREVVNKESVKHITKRQSYMSLLENRLPAVDGSKKDNLETTVESTPFKHAIQDFSMALRQGTLAPKLRELGVNRIATEAAEKGDVDGFIKGLHGGNAGGILKNKPGGPSRGGGSSSNPRSTRKADPSGRQTTTESEKYNSGAKQVGQDKEKQSRKRSHVESPQEELKAARNSQGVASSKRARPDVKTVFGEDQGEETVTERRKTVSFEEPTPKNGRVETTSPILVLPKNLDQVKLDQSVLNETAEFMRRTGQRLTDYNRNSTSIVGSLMGHDNLKQTEELRKPSHDETLTGQAAGPSSSDNVKREGSRERMQNLEEASNTKSLSIEKGIPQAVTESTPLINVLGKPSRKRPHEDVESEQQTDPVTIRSISGIQAKIVKKTERITKTVSTEERTDRSQNTNPVRVEEKQKRAQKRKAPSPPREKR